MAVFDIACANLVYFTMGIGTGCNESAWCYGICLVKLLPGQDWESIICRFPKDAPKKVLHLWRLKFLMYGWSSILGQISNIWDCFTRIFDFWLESWVCFPCTVCFCVDPPPPISPETGTGFGIGTLSWGDTTLQRLLPVVLILILVCQKCCADALTWLSKAKMHMVYSGSPLGEPIIFLLFFRCFLRSKLYFRWHLPTKFVK